MVQATSISNTNYTSIPIQIDQLTTINALAKPRVE